MTILSSIKFLKKKNDIANTAFMDWAVNRTYAARNTTGLPLDPKSAHELHRQFKNIQA